MDLLDRVYPTARDLLQRVDVALSAGGAGADHPVWPLLRRVGALPGDAAQEFAAVPVAPLSEASHPVRVLAERVDAGQSTVPMPAAWRGPAADSYATLWSALSSYLAGDRDSMAGRLVDSASFLDDVTAWLARGRRVLAGTLATCLISSEAVTLRGIPQAPPPAVDPVASAVTYPAATGAVPPPAGTAQAAAAIAAEVLAAFAEIIDDGQRIVDRWAGRLGELAYRPPSSTGTSTAAHIGLG